MTEVVAFAIFFVPSLPALAPATAGFFANDGLALGDAAWAELPIARPRMSDSASTAEEFLFIGGV